MSAHALLIDFGSTYTKLRAVDLAHGRIVGSGQGPSTVGSDVRIGMTAALADLEGRLGGLPEFRHRLASSSAAGGLRMVTVGLVRELTAEAARRAALGAGARLVGTYAYRLTKGDVEAIVAASPDIVLLSGGTDGGNSEVIVANANALARSMVACPIVVAGNRNAADEIREMLLGTGKTVIVAENVMPEFGTLNIEPARAAIRQVFMDRIVHAKGIDQAREMFDRVLMPTPAAVLEGARLVAQGTPEQPGLGELVVVDVGGATTDVHSICKGDPTRPEIVPYGLPEPVAKRTVEGDLGMRYNARTIVETAGAAAIAAEAGVQEADIDGLLAPLLADVERLPGDDRERRFDRALARAAVRTAVLRHAGTVETVYTATGPVTMQRGKDLSNVAALIGTGGPIVHAGDPADVLTAALAEPSEPGSLRPRRPRLLVDREYLLYAVGLLAEVEPDAALALGLNHMRDCAAEHVDGHFSAA
jgi:uncharacterized protein (TIGR01319 family)